MHHLQPDYPSDSSPTRDWPDDKQKFCNASWIFIGFNPKGSSDSEEAKSPTSPLDIKIFSGVGITQENRLDTPLDSTKQQSEAIWNRSPHGLTKSTSQSSMEHSESYSFFTSHGPKSGTKQIYTDCGIECETVQYPVQKQHEHGLWDVGSPPQSYSNVAVFPVAHFLSACYLSKRQLNHGKDIYMYRSVIYCF